MYICTHVRKALTKLLQPGRCNYIIHVHVTHPFQSTDGVATPQMLNLNLHVIEKEQKF